MLPDGTLEPFDWQFVMPFKHWSVEGPEGMAFPGSPRQKRQNTAPVTITTAMEYVDESLRNFQAYRIPSPNPNIRDRFLFPYIRYLNEGTTFLCRETKEIYKVEHVYRDATGARTGEATLSTESGRFLKTTDRLVAMHGEKNSIHFMHAWPKSMPQLYEWNQETGGLAEDGRPFTDTITWSVQRSEPGSLGTQPFAGTRELGPRFREYIIDEQDNCDYVRMVAGQVFDNIIQFDIWAQTPLLTAILTEWFNQFMDLHRWVFLYNGVQKIYFLKQLSDALTTRWRNDIVSSSVQYYFRTENLVNRRIRRIKDISLQIETLDTQEIITPTGKIIDPAGCIDPSGIIVTSMLDSTGQA